MRADDGWLRDEYWIYAEYHTHAQQNVTIQLRFQPWFQLRFQRFQLWFLDHPPVLWFLGLPTQRGHYFCWQEIRHHPHPQAPDGDKAIAALNNLPKDCAVDTENSVDMPVTKSARSSGHSGGKRIAFTAAVGSKMYEQRVAVNNEVRQLQ